MTIAAPHENGDAGRAESMAARDRASGNQEN